MSGSLIAMITVLVIWIGIFLYLLRLDGRVKRIEKERHK
jgi:CcmD family protein